MTRHESKHINGNHENIIKLLSFLCPLVYFASYLTRKDYSIIMQAIIQSENLICKYPLSSVV